MQNPACHLALYIILTSFLRLVDPYLSREKRLLWQIGQQHQTTENEQLLSCLSPSCCCTPPGAPQIEDPPSQSQLTQEADFRQRILYQEDSLYQHNRPTSKEKIGKSEKLNMD